IDRGISNEDRPADRDTGLARDLDEAARMRLSLGPRVAASREEEEAREVELLEDLSSDRRRLVREDRERLSAGVELGERALDARVGSRRDGRVHGVIAEEVLERARDDLGREIGPEAPLDETAHAVPDVVAHLVAIERLEASRAADAVDARGDVIERIDEGAVEVENEEID